MHLLVFKMAMLMGFVFVLICTIAASGAKMPADARVEALELSRVSREVELNSPLVKQKVTMVIENKGSKPVNSLLYLVEPQLAEKVAYIGAHVSILLLP